MIFQTLIPMCSVLVVLTGAQPLQGLVGSVVRSQDGIGGPISKAHLSRTKREIDDALDPDCVKRSVCVWDAKLYKKMIVVPLIGPLWKSYFSDEKKKKSYFILCLLSSLLALFVYFRFKKNAVLSTDLPSDEKQDIKNPPLPGKNELSSDSNASQTTV